MSTTTISSGGACATCSDRRGRVSALSRGIAGYAAGVLLSSSLAAAPAHAQGVEVGLVGGITFCEINASGNERLNVALTDKMELAGGLAVSVEIGDSFSIRPEALVSVKGSRLEVDGSQTDIRLTYLETPVLVRYAAPTARWLQLFAGPYAAYLVKVASDGESDRSPVVDLDDVFDRVDFGWVAGLGVGGGRARLDLRYSGGLHDIARRRTLGGLVSSFETAGVTYRNRGFALLASYFF